MREPESTIIALATSRARSALHVIRISGPASHVFLQKHTSLSNPNFKQVYVRPFKNGGQALDQVLCFFMKSPSSYTGEDMAEIHCHGSLLIADEILASAIADGLTPAAPGEFTRRAFLNGKLSLEQAEAVDALINARSSFLKKSALCVLENKNLLDFSKIKQPLVDLVSDLETSVEFPEHDSGLEDDRRASFERYLLRLKTLRTVLSTLSENYTRASRADGGLLVVIAGAPNTGKSTLMNLLLGRERVIVSPQAGTTRDYVSEEIILGGILIKLIDTAGLRSSDEHIEAEGIRRSRSLLAEADAVIFLTDGSEEKSFYAEVRAQTYGKPLMTWITKSDLLSLDKIKQTKNILTQTGFSAPADISLLNPQAAEIFQKSILEYLAPLLPAEDAGVSLLNSRQQYIAEEVLASLSIVEEMLVCGTSEEILLEELKLLQNQFAQLDASYSNEDIFDAIFSKFCLGK